MRWVFGRDHAKAAKESPRSLRNRKTAEPVEGWEALGNREGMEGCHH